MTDRILKILDNVRYWETCPEDYKKDIETFLEAQSQALHIHDVVGRSEQLMQSNSVCLHEPQYQNYNRDTGLQICDKCGVITN